MNYEQNSHTHCYNQQSPACGLKGRHCCLCDIVTQRDKSERDHNILCGARMDGRCVPDCTFSPKEEKCDHSTCYQHTEDGRDIISTPLQSRLQSLSSAWEETEREAWLTSFSSFKTVDDMAHYWIERMKAIREEGRQEVVKETEDIIREFAKDNKNIRSAVLEEVREILENMKRTKKPTHGTCCTCQTCGGNNEGDCDCAKNLLIDRILSSLQNLKNK